MKRVVIIGGGFAGLSAARRLAGRSRELECILLDRRPTFDFLPLLPEVVGGLIEARYLSYDLAKLSRRIGFIFRPGDVQAVDLDSRSVTTESETLPWDYLIIASGARTDFLGRRGLAEHALCVDSVATAERTARALFRCRSVVVCGGGYTGVEVAGNVRARFNRTGCSKGILLVEMEKSVLPKLHRWIGDYTLDHMRRLGVEVVLKGTVSEVGADKVVLSDGRELRGALLIWTAGVRTSPFLRDLPVEKDDEGRVVVDKYLGVCDGCFAAGDAAHYERRGESLRMAVQFAIDEGACAARNVLHLLTRTSLEEFRPLDLGHIVPLADGSGAGYVLGLKQTGLPPMLMHYFMTVFRSCGVTNRLAIVKQLLAGRLTGRGNPS